MCMQKPSQDITGPALWSRSGPGALLSLSGTCLETHRMTLASAHLGPLTCYHPPPCCCSTVEILKVTSSSSRFPRNPREGKDWKIFGKIPMAWCDPSDCIAGTGFYNFHIGTLNIIRQDQITELTSVSPQKYKLREASK